MATRDLQIDLPDGIADRLEGAAANLNRSFSDIVEEALGDWLREEARHQATLVGLAQVDAGNLIDHEDVLAFWAKKLDAAQPGPKSDEDET